MIVINLYFRLGFLAHFRSGTSCWTSLYKANQMRLELISRWNIPSLQHTNLRFGKDL